MKTAKTILALVLAIAANYVVCSMLRAEDNALIAQKKRLKVGVFDSRAIAVAYCGSVEHEAKLKKMMDEYKKAKAQGNAKKVAELEAAGKAGQQKMHMQGFSTASVSELLEHIKDQIPAIAKQTGVDVIVSKWDIVYQAPDAEFVDVTDALIKPFHPDERKIKIINEMKKQTPMPLEQARQIKD
ncbi:MAG: hypothetical protein ACWGMZ_02025 [Thermoguttaceae bacterium]